MRILFLVPYPKDEAPSQRFRFEQYLEILEKNGIDYDLKPYMSTRTWAMYYKPGRFFRKILGLKMGYLRRWGTLFRIRRYDLVFIHREAVPVGPPIIEWLITKVFGKKMIYDFDDAIWLPNYSRSNRWFFWMKRYSNVKTLTRWSWKTSCGNSYLCAFARKYSGNAVYNPTTIDTENYHNKMVDHDASKIVIGWTGSHSTMRYLQKIYPALIDLEKKYDFEFRVISDQKPDLDLRSMNFIEWDKSREIEDLAGIHIGVMPLTEDRWSKGKCGFKALQYMALGMAAVVSPVGVNRSIIDDGKNGIICNNTTEWKYALEKLLRDKSLRKDLGKAARKKVEEGFSVRSNTANFLHLFALETKKNDRS